MTVAAAGNHRAGIVVVFRVRLALFLSFFSCCRGSRMSWRLGGYRGFTYLFPHVLRGAGVLCLVPHVRDLGQRPSGR